MRLKENWNGKVLVIVLHFLKIRTDAINVHYENRWIAQWCNHLLSLFSLHLIRKLHVLTNIHSNIDCVEIQGNITS